VAERGAGVSGLVYIAGPIDQAGPYEKELAKTRAEVKQELSGAGFATYDPSLPYTEGQREAQALVSVNNAALRESVGLLAILPRGAASIGVPMEIQAALGMGKPVVVLGGIGSVQLEGEGVPTVEDPRLAALELRELVEAARWAGRNRDDEIRWVGEELDGAWEPQRAHEGDAGFDLFVSKPVRIAVGAFVDVPCGISVQFPPGVWGMITGRSSTLRKRGLLVAQGIIDNGYRGPLYAGVQNLGDKVQDVGAGERLAQIIPFPVLADGLSWVRVSKLAEHARGQNGFGSTGA
jgi:dUTP pyrophosphatase